MEFIKWSLLGLVFLSMVNCGKPTEDLKIKENLSNIEQRLGISSNDQSILERTEIIKKHVSDLYFSTIVIGSGCRDTVRSEDSYSAMIMTRAVFPTHNESIHFELPEGASIASLDYSERIGHHVVIQGLSKGTNMFSGYILNENTQDSLLFTKTFFVK